MDAVLPPRSPPAAFPGIGQRSQCVQCETICGGVTDIPAQGAASSSTDRRRRLSRERSRSRSPARRQRRRSRSNSSASRSRSLSPRRRRSSSSDTRRRSRYSRRRSSSRSPARRRRSPSADATRRRRSPSADSYDAYLRERRQELPVFGFKAQLLEAVRTHNVIVCVGETGSGKTTQIPQYLYEGGFCKGNGLIAVTQPRRVAATSVARRVAEEKGCKVGGLVGYKVRFLDVTSSDTKIKFMTDGTLVRESLVDPDLKQYSVIMLDEAHERGINTDILLGLLKGVLRRRSDLKLLITSATVDTQKFAEYLDNCPVLFIPGRTYTVALHYSKLDFGAKARLGVGKGKGSITESVVDTVMRIHKREDPGDILVFLTGQDDVELACRELRRQAAELEAGGDGPRMLVLPLYGSLPSEEQSKVFRPTPSMCRKVVVATNIAETSITVDGVRFVVDAGFVKEKQYDAARGMEFLSVVPISKTSAAQRAGRAGRTGPGKCYRLYTEDMFKKFAEQTLPEIRRSNLASIVLYLKVLGVHDVMGFEFLDPPDMAAIEDALRQLYCLGALDQNGAVTSMGRHMSEYPLEPKLARMLVSATQHGCIDDGIFIAALMSTETVFYHPPKRANDGKEGKSDDTGALSSKELEARAAHAKFFHELGDFFTYIRVYQQWLMSGQSDDWCRDNFVMDKAKLSKPYVGDDIDLYTDNHKRAIQHAVADGFALNCAQRCANDAYRLITDDVKLVYVHPTSCMCWFVLPEFVIYYELVYTTRGFMRHVMTVKSEWLRETLVRSREVNVLRLSGREPPITEATEAAAEEDAARQAAEAAEKAAAALAVRDAEVSAARQRALARAASRKK